MYIERTNYWAKPGLLDAVIALRRDASAVRVKIGLPAGFICLKAGADGPDVRWTCVFPSEEEYLRDIEVRATNPDFLVVRHRMPPLVDRFERHIEVIDETSRSRFTGVDLQAIFA